MGKREAEKEEKIEKETEMREGKRQRGSEKTT